MAEFKRLAQGEPGRGLTMTERIHLYKLYELATSNQIVTVRPAVMRTPTTHRSVFRKIEIKGTLEELTDGNKKALKEIIAQLSEVSVEELVINFSSGSIILNVELPVEAAEKLDQLWRENDIRLRILEVTNVESEEEPDATEVEWAEEPDDSEVNTEPLESNTNPWYDEDAD